eukprot:364033-Chlamydomonas_euryale.AAC.6
MSSTTFDLEISLERNVVVRHDRHRLQAGTDKVVDEHRLELGLPALEVVAADKHVAAHRHLDHARHKRVLRRAVDKRHALLHRRDGIQRRRRNLRLVALNRCQQIVRGVVEAVDELGVALRVCGPQDDDLVDTAGRLEVTNLLAHHCHLLRLGALDDVCGTRLLVGRNEQGIVDACMGQGQGWPSGRGET